MICYSCNRRVGTVWVEVCPYCGNRQIQAQNLEMHAKIEKCFAEPDTTEPEPSEGASGRG